MSKTLSSNFNGGNQKPKSVSATVDNSQATQVAGGEKKLQYLDRAIIRYRPIEGAEDNAHFIAMTESELYKKIQNHPRVTDDYWKTVEVL